MTAIGKLCGIDIGGGSSSDCVLIDGTRQLTGDWNIGNYNFGIGVDPTYKLDIYGTPGDEEFRGTYINMAPSGVFTSGHTHYGSYMYINSDADENGHTSAIYGQRVWIQTTSSGNIDQLNGVDVRLRQMSTGAPSSMRGLTSVLNISNGTVTQAHGLYLAIGQSGGTLTTAYGIRISLTGTIGTAWGIHLSGDIQNYFSGNLGLGSNPPTAKLDVNSDIIRLRTSKTPANASAAGNAGDICWDSNYIYICTATNTWKRSALSTWGP